MRTDINRPPPSGKIMPWVQYLEELRKKWDCFTNEIFTALAEEEMKLRREELQRQFEVPNRPE